MRTRRRSFVAAGLPLRSQGMGGRPLALAIAFTVLVAALVVGPQSHRSADAASDDWRYRRAYSFGAGAHIADLGLIDGVPHVAVQRQTAGGGGEIHIVSVDEDGYLLRNRITNPSQGGSWGHLLAEVPDADGDGVTDLATFTGLYRMYVISGKQTLGATLTGEQAKVYSMDFDEEPRGFVGMFGRGEYAIGEFSYGATRRTASTGGVLQTVTGAFVASGIGDFTGDGVDDYLMQSESSLFVMSGAEAVSGSASDLAVATFSDPTTPGLGYAEDNNNIATTMGDLTGDGVPELAVGSRAYKLDIFGRSVGRVVVFNGATGEVLYRIEQAQASLPGDSAYFGNNVVSPGDLDGDGYGDLVVSARGYQRPGGADGADGAIVAFSGIDGAELWRAYGDSEALGDYEVTLIDDMNDDGLPELGVASGNASIWMSCDNTSASGCDADASVPALDDDGVADAIEDGAPNGGDANFDGVPDKQQSNVASMPNSEDGSYVTLTSTGPTRLLGVTAFAPPLGAPNGATFPIGMFGFQVDGLLPGSAVIVTLTLHGATSVTSHWKYGPEAGDLDSHWYEFLFDGTTGATFNGNTVTLHFIDGGRGDQDLLANGVVIDPSAPATDGCSGAPSTAGSHRTGLVDPASGQWHLYDCVSNETKSFYFGNPGDYPFMGDWDGDGIETPGLYRQSDGYVYLRNSNTQGNADVKFYFGDPGDVPVAGDFNANGFDTVSIYRPSNQTFYIINKLGANDGGLGAAEVSYVFGNPGDKPFVGDFDGDGIETVGLHRESTGLVYFRNSHTQGNADSQFIFGDPGDRLVAGDWNSTGVFTPALFRPSNTTTYFRFTNTQGNANYDFAAGQSSWIPVAGYFGP